MEERRVWGTFPQVGSHSIRVSDPKESNPILSYTKVFLPYESSLDLDYPSISWKWSTWETQQMFLPWLPLGSLEFWFWWDQGLTWDASKATTHSLQDESKYSIMSGSLSFCWKIRKMMGHNKGKMSKLKNLHTRLWSSMLKFKVLKPALLIQAFCSCLF